MVDIATYTVEVGVPLTLGAPEGIYLLQNDGPGSIDTGYGFLLSGSSLGFNSGGPTPTRLLVRLAGEVPANIRAHSNGRISLLPIPRPSPTHPVYVDRWDREDVL